MNPETLLIPTMAEMSARGEHPEVLVWVGCAGSFDVRYQKVTRTLCRLLVMAGIRAAILGIEEKCTGDPAKRAGNEYLFQLMALANIRTLNHYGISVIVTACPHCYNTLKNEYAGLGGHYEVYHHTEYIQKLIHEGKLKIPPGYRIDQKIVYHDSCYLGRGNNIYEAPRDLLKTIQPKLKEMPRSRSNSFCCGAGGAQVFKESGKDAGEINLERLKEACGTGAQTIVTACPFCMMMFRDGLKSMHREEIQVFDIIELIEKPAGGAV